MKIQFLGTAAFEGIPAFFCECEVCKKSMELGGRNIRTRSQALIDDKILIDFPADTYSHFIQHKIPLAQIKTCIITHSHSDHLYPKDIVTRQRGFSGLKNMEPLHFYSDKSSYESIEKTISDNLIKEDEIQNHLIEVCVPFEAEGYKITPLRASHSPDTTPVIYLIEKDGKCIFYATDSGYFPEKTWEYLANSGVKIDLVAFDCTFAWKECNYDGHMGIKNCIEVRERMAKIGAVHKDTVFILNHFSHNATGVVYDDMAVSAAAEDFLVSYDGMIIEV